MSIQDQGIFAAISLIGLKLEIFDCLYEGALVEDDLLNLLEYDNEYVRKWIIAAEGYELLERHGNVLSLSSLGASYSSKSPSPKIAHLVQSVFSVLIAHEILPDLQSGKRPGYGIVNRFENIAPWYNYVNSQVNLPVLKEIFEFPEVKEFLGSIQGNTADFSCGNGWFLDQIKPHVKDSKLFGVTNSNMMTDSAHVMSQDSFFESDLVFDLIVLNKVLHHIWGDEALLSGIFAKLSIFGKILVWEFKWDFEISEITDFKEVAFLNLVEHMQGAEYIPTKQVREYFGDRGFSCNTIDVDSKRQIVYLLEKNDHNGDEDIFFRQLR